MPDPTETPTNADVIRDLAFKAADPQPVDTDEDLVVVNGTIHDLRQFHDAPQRPRGAYSVHTLESLIDYLKGQAAGDALTVWVDDRLPGVAAVLNDNAAQAPGHGDHRVTLGLRRTPEWQRWLALDGHLGDQHVFAEHIEDSLPDIVEPDGADLLEIAQSFQASTAVQFRSGQRLSSGETQLTYVEETQATAGRSEQLTVPAQFVLNVAPFVGEQAQQVIARLRYRVRAGNLSIGYKLDRPEVVELDAIDLIAARLRREFDGKVFEGSPPTA